MTARRGYLLLRRGGGVWGIESERVTGLARSDWNDRGEGAGGSGSGSGAAYRVTTAAEPLAADEILGVAADLEVRRPARAVARWWPAGSDGCAVWSGLPVAVVDPLDPPQALRLAPSGESSHGD